MKEKLATFLSGILLGAALLGTAAVATELVVLPTTSKLLLNGSEVQATAYNINGNNYYKLRDLAAAVDHAVWFDGDRNEVHIDTGSPYDPDYVYPTDAQVQEAYDAAVEAMIWFDLSSMDVLADSTPEPDGARMVDHPTIKTLADLKAHLHGLFSEEIVATMLPDDGTKYRDVNGRLYVREGARGGDITRGDATYQIIRSDPKKILYRATVEELSDDLETVVGHADVDVTYEYTEAGWRFTQFELVW